jgi:type I restriction-modification system DNA methylase subunit
VHILSYIQEGGKIQISVRKKDPLLNYIRFDDTESDIYMWKSCKECREDGRREKMKSRSWECSFYKFLNNFFCHEAGSKSDCGH